MNPRGWNAQRDATDDLLTLHKKNTIVLCLFLQIFLTNKPLVFFVSFSLQLLWQNEEGLGMIQDPNIKQLKTLFFENTNFNFCVAKSRKKTFPTCAHFSLVSGLPTLERCHLHSINDFRGNMFAQTCGNCSELSHFSCCFVVWGDCFCISICELGLMLMIS